MKREYFNRGKRSNIYLGVFKGEKVAIKEEKKGIGAVNVARKEGKWLKLLNKQGIGPKLIKSGKNYVMYEFIEGEFIGKYLERANKKEIKSIFLKVLDKCRKMDELGVNKLEMTNPYKHVIVGKEIKMVDFERCKESKDPKNVTQFFQYMMSKRLNLDKKGIKFNRKKIIGMLKDYKKDFSEERYKKLRRLVSDL